MAPDEQTVILREWRRFRDHYRSHPEDARAYVQKTLLPLSAPEGLAYPEIAALTRRPSVAKA